MSILVRGLLSVSGQCKLDKDAPNFCSGWSSMMVFTLIFPLKVPAHRLDKGFFIDEYFGTGTFECCRAMPSGKRCSKLCSGWVSSMVFTLSFTIESTGS